MKNQHGLECPMPLKDWPEWANYVVVAGSGNIYAYSHEPVYVHSEWRSFVENPGEVYTAARIGRTLKTVVPYYHIWKRPE